MSSHFLVTENAMHLHAGTFLGALKCYWMGAAGEAADRGFCAGSQRPGA